MGIFDKAKEFLGIKQENKGGGIGEGLQRIQNQTTSDASKNLGSEKDDNLSAEFTNELGRDWTKINLGVFIGLGGKGDVIQIAENTHTNQIEVINRSKGLVLSQEQKNFALVEGKEYIIGRDPEGNELGKEVSMHAGTLYDPSAKSSTFVKGISGFSAFVSGKHIAMKLENEIVYIKQIGKTNSTKYSDPVEIATKITPRV